MGAHLSYMEQQQCRQWVLFCITSATITVCFFVKGYLKGLKHNFFFVYEQQVIYFKLTSLHFENHLLFKSIYFHSLNPCYSSDSFCQVCCLALSTMHLGFPISCMSQWCKYQFPLSMVSVSFKHMHCALLPLHADIALWAVASNGTVLGRGMGQGQCKHLSQLHSSLCSPAHA